MHTLAPFLEASSIKFLHIFAFSLTLDLAQNCPIAISVIRFRKSKIKIYYNCLQRIQYKIN